MPKIYRSYLKYAIYIDTIPIQKKKSEKLSEIGYHHFVAPINIEGKIYRVLISGKEKYNSKKLYSLNVEVLPQINTNEFDKKIQKDLSILELVYNVKIYNYETGKNILYNASKIKYSDNKK